MKMRALHGQGMGRVRALPGWRALVALACGASPGVAQVSFVDATGEAGITFVNHGLGINHAGVAAVDLDLDGYPELFFQDGYNGANHLYMNNRDGTFTEAGASWGVRTTEFTVAPVFFDFDNDGLLDLALASRVSEAEQRVRLLRNVGGRFVEVSDDAGLAERWGSPTSTVLKSMTAFDYDGDGFADMFVSYAAPCLDLMNSGIVYHNRGDGTFELTRPCQLMSTGCAQWQAMAGDLDLDGLLDVFTAEDYFTESHVFLNDGRGSLIDVGVTVGITGNSPDMGIGMADYDNDGDFDVYVTDITDRGNGGNRLFRNEVLTLGRLEFTEVARDAGVYDTAVGWGATFFDYDNDGWLDLGVASSNRASKLFRNRADGGFDDVGAPLGFAPPAGARGMAAVDYDLDGDLDVILARLDGPAQLLRNDGGAAAPWLKVRLHDRTGRDPEAMGAKVTVRTPGLDQIREVRSGANFNSQEPFELHFGLGNALKAMSVRVEWPDGAVTTSGPFAARRLVHLSRSLADTDLNARVDTRDVLRYLNAWAAQSGEADFDGDGVIDAADFQAYIAVFLRDWK